MEMTRFEKFFVNRERKGLGNLQRVRRALARIDAESIRDVLEVGCGIGTVSARLADELGWNVSGTDYDPHQIEEARRRHLETDRLRYRCEDATGLTFPDASFDFAFTQMAFHHIPAWRDAVAELARVVRPRGAVYWQDFVIAAPLAAWIRPLARYFGVCSPESVDAAFAGAGFDRIFAGRAGLAGVSLSERIFVRR